MPNAYYTATGWPAQGSPGTSAPGRGELAAIAAGFDKLPVLSGNGSKPIFVNAGGTALEATTAAAARTKLGVVIGTDVQAWSDDLDDLAALTPTDGNIIVGDGTDWVAESGATARASLGLAIGADVQAYDAELAALAGLTSAANKGIQFTGAGTAGTFDLTAAGKALLDDADAEAQRATLDVYSQAEVDALVAAILPAGTMLDYGGGTIPDGYIAADGANVSRTTYAALFTAYGETWGVGDGSTTFGVPDSRRRVAVGSGGTGTGTLGNAVGDTGGEESHTLTGAESGTGVHGHSASGSFSVSETDVGAGASLAAPIIAGNRQTSGATTTQSVSVTVNNNSASAASSAHNNLPPSYVVTKIIKT